MGNHIENGIWAVLVIIIIGNPKEHKRKSLQFQKTLELQFWNPKGHKCQCLKVKNGIILESLGRSKMYKRHISEFQNDKSTKFLKYKKAQMPRFGIQKGRWHQHLEFQKNISAIISKSKRALVPIFCSPKDISAKIWNSKRTSELQFVNPKGHKCQGVAIQKGTNAKIWYFKRA